MWPCSGLCGNPFLVISVGTSNVYHAGRLLKESQGITMDNQLRTTHPNFFICYLVILAPKDISAKAFWAGHSFPSLACTTLRSFGTFPAHLATRGAVEGMGDGQWETGWGSQQGGVTVGNHGMVPAFGCTWSWRHNFLYHLSDGFFLDH